MPTYRLGSSTLINAPGMLNWARNGYHFKKDRKSLLNVFVSGWGGTPNSPTASTLDKLLKGEIPYELDGETVVFTVDAELGKD